MRAVITVQTLMAHSPLQGEPTVVECVWSEQSDSDELPYVRPALNVGETPVALEAGWVENPGMFCVENLEGRFLLTNPTLAQQAEISSKVVNVIIGDGAIILVRPGRTLPFEPSDFKQVRLRCQKGIAKVKITVFPK